MVTELLERRGGRRAGYPAAKCRVLELGACGAATEATASNAACNGTGRVRVFNTGFWLFSKRFLRDAISFTLPARSAHAALGLLVSTVGQQCTMRAAFRDARKGSAKHRISVSVRVKPASAECSPTISADSRGIVVKQKVFTPEAVITGCDQAEAFAAIASPLLARLRDGYSCTLLAYGQTGSGKTHTMFGPPGALTEASLAASADACPPDWGIFPRIALELLAAGGTLHASAIEVYQDNAYDLLAAAPSARTQARRSPPGARTAGCIRTTASAASASNGRSRNERSARRGATRSHGDAQRRERCPRLLRWARRWCI